MKQFIQTLCDDIRNLVYGRPHSIKLVERKSPKKIIIVDISRQKSTSPIPISREEQLRIMLRSVQSQSKNNIIVLPFDDPTLLAEFTNKNRSLIFTYILGRLTHAINQDWSAVTLFQFANSKKLAEIKRTFYKDQLDVLMDWFVNVEDYESATECRELLKQLNNTNVD